MMNKDYDPDALKASYIMVGVDYAAPSPTQPRKTFDEAAMADLTESVAKHGVLQPIIVRLWPNEYPSPGPLVTYEIIAGERRWRAAKAAGLTMLEAKLRTLTDLEVLEIQIIENLQRSDLHPLEEAEGYERIMGTHAYTVEQLAEKIGKSRSYIFARLKLLALDDDARRLFLAGKLNPSTALLVARIPSVKLRLRAIEDITTPHYGNEPMSVRQAHERIRARYMTKLTEAPFNQADAALIPTAGSCHDCPHRTGNSPDLFDDIGNPDVCTDPDCFVAKKIAHRDAEAEKAQAAGAKVILGDDSKKIAPWGANCGLKGHTKLTDKCWEDPDKRTYAEILGETAEPILLEDTNSNTLFEVMPNKVLAEKLVAAGVKLRDTERAKADVKVKAKLDLERATRQRMYDMVRENVARMVDDDGANMAYFAQERIFSHITQRMWERFSSDTRPLVANLWGAVGKNNTERAEAFGLGIPNLSTADCWKLMVDMLLITSTTVSTEWDLEHGNKLLATFADLFDIDAAEVKKSVQAEQKAPADAVKPGKKPKKPSPATSENHFPPTKAAPAAALKRAENTEAPTEAARANDETQLSSASCEADAKPSGAEMAFSVDDRVRIVGGAHSLNEIGVVECVYFDGRKYPYDVIVNCNQYGFCEAELTLVEKAIETDETPSAPNRPAAEYQHPENSELTWTGRGRKPKWVEAWLTTTGHTLDELRTTWKADSSAPAGANAKPTAADMVAQTMERKTHRGGHGRANDGTHRVSRKEFVMNAKPLCIYHHDCADGFAAAWVVRKFYGDGNVDFHAGIHGNPPPDVTGRPVIIVDFSYKRPVMLALIEQASSVLILDHHKTAADDLAGLPEKAEVEFDMTRSGAMITWERFFRDQAPPLLLNYIEDRDLWRFNYPCTRDVTSALFAYPFEFLVWDVLIENGVRGLINEGLAINRARRKEIAQLIEGTRRMVQIGEYTVPVANVPWIYASDVGHELSKGHPFAATYYDDTDGRRWSLRSQPDGADVAAIAESFGGGGHPHAAGFRMICERAAECDRTGRVDMLLAGSQHDMLLAAMNKILAETQLGLNCSQTLIRRTAETAIAEAEGRTA